MRSYELFMFLYYVHISPCRVDAYIKEYTFNPFSICDVLVHQVVEWVVDYGVG